MEIVRGDQNFTQTHKHTPRPILCLVFLLKCRNKTKKNIIKYKKIIDGKVMIVTHESSRGAWGKGRKNVNFIFTLGDAIISLY